MMASWKPVGSGCKSSPSEKERLEWQIESTAEESGLNQKGWAKAQHFVLQSRLLSYQTIKDRL